MNFNIEIEVETDGRFIAEVVELPGVLVYGQTEEEAITKVQTLALHVLAERVERGEAAPDVVTLFRYNSLFQKKTLPDSTQITGGI
jgi:predicted RNase H-like HicB family nuclease